MDSYGQSILAQCTAQALPYHLVDGYSPLASSTLQFLLLGPASQVHLESPPTGTQVNTSSFMKTQVIKQTVEPSRWLIQQQLHTTSYIVYRNHSNTMDISLTCCTVAKQLQQLLIVAPTMCQSTLHFQLTILSVRRKNNPLKLTPSNYNNNNYSPWQTVRLPKNL